MLYLEIVGVNFCRENGLKKKHEQTKMHRFVWMKRILAMIFFVNRV